MLYAYGSLFNFYERGSAIAYMFTRNLSNKLAFFTNNSFFQGNLIYFTVCLAPIFHPNERINRNSRCNNDGSEYHRVASELRKSCLKIQIDERESSGGYKFMQFLMGICFNKTFNRILPDNLIRPVIGLNRYNVCLTRLHK